MGNVARVIDAVALGLSVDLVAFLYFFQATGNAWAGAAMAAAPAALAVWGFTRWSARRTGRREQARRARAAVEQLAFLPEGEARARAARYAGFTGVFLQRHPKGRALDADDVLALWRNAAGDALEIATTGSVSEEAWAAAEALDAPSVRLYDARSLAERFKRSELAGLSEAPPKKRRRRRISVPRKRAKHCAVYGCAMLGVYLVTGLWTYLAAALILLALTSLALRPRLERHPGSPA